MSSVEDLTREALEAELTSTKAALIDAALIHAKLIQERDEARRDLGALLAVIHGDGGHHTGEFGVSQSVADAHATWAVVVRERYEAWAERDHERTVANEQLARAHDAVRERDEARAEVERLRADLARCREVQRATAEGWRHEVAEIASLVGAPAHTAELAACVRAEVERLRRERDHERTVANEQLARAHDAVRERDEAREECAELRDYAETVGLRAVTDASETYKVVVGERDIAEAEIERLRAEVERLRALLDGYSTGDE